MPKIIGFHGRKQSGKNTSCNYIMAYILCKYGVCKNASININGDIIVSDLFGEEVSGLNWVPLTSEYVDTDMLFSNFNTCKIYAFADPLKKFCIEVLGLSHKQVYGTDADKNTLTHLRWENMPGVITDIHWSILEGHLNPAIMCDPDAFNLTLAEGPMTAREVLQYVGTDIFRKMYQSVWIDAIFRKINKDNPEIALICDVRFDDEIKSIQDKGGVVIGLTRDNLNSEGSHASEKSHFELCDHVIDNNNMSIEDLANSIMSLTKKYL